MNRITEKNRMLVPASAHTIFTVLAFASDRLFGSALAGMILLLEAACLCVWFLAEDRTPVSMRAILSASWIGGEGIAAFRLSNLHPEWAVLTWISFYAFYLCFLVGYRVGDTRFQVKEGKKKKTCSLKRLYICILAAAGVSTAAFVFEALYLGYIPLFSSVPHAYDHFHVTGVHYFTVSCMFVPALSLLWYVKGGFSAAEKRRKWLFLFCNLSAFAIPILCVSKYMFILNLALPLILYFLNRELPLKKIILWIAGAGILFAAAAVCMTLLRHYEAGYLAEEFEIKDPNMPVALQLVYIYIANNYANFNLLVEQTGSGVFAYTFGIRQLFPVIALTGLKFVIGNAFPYGIPVVKETLNTLTIIYDAYCDFGLAGVILFALLLGFVCSRIFRAAKKGENPIFQLFFAECCLYLMLSFFSTWFSNPTTWFWFVLTGVMAVYVGGFPKKGGRKEKL